MVPVSGLGLRERVEQLLGSVMAFLQVIYVGGGLESALTVLHCLPNIDRLLKGYSHA